MVSEYEKAYANYFQKLKIVNLPLLSWGIFSNENSEIYQYNKIQNSWIDKEIFRNITIDLKKEILITDQDFNIVFASSGIFNITGYQSNELLGKSPKIFQGLKTNETSRSNIRNAVQNKLPFKEIILNYKKDGSTYKCEIEGFPKFNEKGEFLNYIAFEKVAA